MQLFKDNKILNLLNNIKDNLLQILNIKDLHSNLIHKIINLQVVAILDLLLINLHLCNQKATLTLLHVVIVHRATVRVNHLLAVHLNLNHLAHHPALHVVLVVVHQVVEEDKIFNIKF